MPNAISAEMRDIVHLAAGTPQPGESVKSQINRAARTLQIGYRRVRSFWYEQPAAVRADEADHLRAMQLRILAERRNRLAAEIETIDARLRAKGLVYAVGSMASADADRRNDSTGMGVGA